MMAGEAARAQGSSPPRTQRLISQFMHIQSANSPENFIHDLEDHNGSDAEALGGRQRRSRRRLEGGYRRGSGFVNDENDYRGINAFDDGLQRATSSQLYDEYDCGDDEDMDSNEQSNS